MPAVTTGAAEIGGASTLGGASVTPASYSLTSGAAGAGSGLSTAGMNIAPGLGGAGAGASKGILASAMSSPYFAPAAITAGTQLAGGLIQGAGMQKQEKDKLAAYNSNVGTRLYA